MSTAAPDDSIEELLPPPLPSTTGVDAGAIVEMTFDVDAATPARGRTHGTHGPRHKKPPPPPPRPGSSGPAAHY